MLGCNNVSLHIKLETVKLEPYSETLQVLKLIEGKNNHQRGARTPRGGWGYSFQLFPPSLLRGAPETVLSVRVRRYSPLRYCLCVCAGRIFILYAWIRPWAPLTRAAPWRARPLTAPTTWPAEWTAATGAALTWLTCWTVWVLVSCTIGWWTVWWVLTAPVTGTWACTGTSWKKGWAAWWVLTIGAGWKVAILAGMWVRVVFATGWVMVEIWGTTSA